MWHPWERREKSARFCWESPKERDRSEDRGVYGIGKDLEVDRLWGLEWI
jgi:hypothetical protein